MINMGLMMMMIDDFFWGEGIFLCVWLPVLYCVAANSFFGWQPFLLGLPIFLFCSLQIYFCGHQIFLILAITKFAGGGKQTR